MALLTRADWRRQSRLAWACLGLVLLVAGCLWLLDRRGAALGTLAAMAGCLGLILPPRERMAVLPGRLRRLPRRLDAAPVLATLLSTPGYGLNWFHGANPYDEVVHLLSGILAGAVLAGLLHTDGRPRPRGRLALLGLGFGLGLAVAWEAFEAATGLIGSAGDTVSDIVLTTAGAAFGNVWGAAPRRPAPG
ncbi:hypothetical protein [Falsiroseomonas selenitidurans]|uniref:VanZ-like domain-containing protein n=1 Tax=Falsiroseomonas selenitidurans TaxID=2716335 RepID=A0ABX1DWU1_9PROT|nr:hypothetical protein [Falsiroseomonas selenitidurans]NKC29361.1 hypothetical protein [Falsiroseomonas selenitidurans]